MRRTVTVLCAFSCLALSVLAGGCKDDVKAAQFVEPVFGDPCSFADCSEHGMCQVTASGGPECLCEVGYQGSECQLCEPGFHRDARDLCAPDRSCAEQPSNPCGHGGRCVDADGVIACACDEGYEGPRCTLCEDRYQRDEFGRCLPVFVVIDGSDPMTCAEGYTGTGCTTCAKGYHAGIDRCLPDETCTPERCPVNATCGVVTGVAECACLPGYQGTNCFACAEGFHPQDDACVPDEVCGENSCSPNATCRVVQGVVECPCDPGYADSSADSVPDCAACAGGYHGENGSCVPDQTCIPGTCPSTSTCAVVAGVAQCTCLPGYTGDQCDTCQSGFHKVGSVCALDEYCELNSCPLHATCEVVGGEVTCPCDPGWGPAGECDVCESYATERSGFEFPTGWPTRENTCLLHVELSVSRTTFRSRVGPSGPEGSVYQCARSTYSQMSSQHVELEAYTARPAALTFEEPAHLVAFDYGSRVEAIAMEVRAHDNPMSDLNGTGRVVGMLSLEANRRDSASFLLDPPARMLSFWSRNNKLQHVALDDVTYTYPQCR